MATLTQPTQRRGKSAHSLAVSEYDAISLQDPGTAGGAGQTGLDRRDYLDDKELDKNGVADIYGYPSSKVRRAETASKICSKADPLSRTSLGTSRGRWPVCCKPQQPC